MRLLCYALFIFVFNRWAEAPCFGSRKSTFETSEILCVVRERPVIWSVALVIHRLLLLLLLLLGNSFAKFVKNAMTQNNVLALSSIFQFALGRCPRNDSS